MLHIQNLTYRIAGRLLFDQMTMHLPKGHRGAIIGRNGAGKSTLFRLILQELQPDLGDVTLQKGARVGMVAQETPSGPETPLEFVLKADEERARLTEEAEYATDPNRIAEIHIRLAEIGAHGAPARAAKILYGLGFDEAAQQRPLSSFSGGWRMRVALAAVLFAEPDLLLLDEPTNHLDFEAAIWLEKFLKNYPRTLLIISHDRHFLNAIVDRVYHLSHLKLTLYNGDYEFFEKTRREKLALQEAAKVKQDAQRKHIQKFIDRFRAKTSKAALVQSRIKRLEKFEPITILQDEANVELSFPEPQNLSPPLITLDRVSTGYGDKVVLKNLNQRIDPEDRIALLGANGNGKSTFAKLLSGLVEPFQGKLQASNKLRVGYFHQHQIEALNPDETAYEHMEHLMRGVAPDRIRARLGRFGFSRDKADVPARKLSGGEKVRLNFALVTLAEPQMIILDEPTNHLDMETRESLTMAINDFAGAVILITHDWHLLELTADRLWLVENETVKAFSGDLNDYRRLVLGNRSSVGEALKKQTDRDRAAEIKAKKQKKKNKKKEKELDKKKGKKKKN